MRPAKPVFELDLIFTRPIFIPWCPSDRNCNLYRIKTQTHTYRKFFQPQDRWRNKNLRSLRFLSRNVSQKRSKIGFWRYDMMFYRKNNLFYRKHVFTSFVLLLLDQFLFFKLYLIGSARTLMWRHTDYFGTEYVLFWNFKHAFTFFSTGPIFNLGMANEIDFPERFSYFSTRPTP